MVIEFVAVDLRHDEGDVRLHSEGGAVVNGYGTVAGGQGREFAADGGGCGDEGEIHFAEQFGGGEFDGYLLAPELEFLAYGAFGGAEADGLEGQVALFENVEENLSDGAGGADDGDAALVQSGCSRWARFRGNDSGLREGGSRSGP